MWQSSEANVSLTTPTAILSVRGKCLNAALYPVRTAEIH
jgi:hypothetical protein